MSWLELLLIPLGFVVGVYGTLVGAGGGFVLVPVLLLLFPDEEPVSITSISLAVVFFNAVSATGAFARLRRIDYVTGAIFAGSSIPGALAGALLVSLVPRRLFDLLFALVLLGLADAAQKNRAMSALRELFVAKQSADGVLLASAAWLTTATRA